MSNKPENLFHGMDMTPLGALGNIEDLLAGAEVCLCSASKEANSIGFNLIEFARKYANESREENKQ